jgi:hypothetical protein
MKFTKLAVAILSSTSLFTFGAFAQSDYQLSCDANITSNIAFANNQLTVESSKQEKILFTSTGVVYVDDQKINLNKEEQAKAQQYFRDAEDAIPMVVEITVEALNVTNMALTEVFKGLLGEKSVLPQTLNKRINEISNAIQEHVYQDPNSLTFNSAHLKGDIGLGENLDQEIEAIKQEIISSMMGQLIVAIGQSMMNGDGNFSELEARMNTLGKDIETKAEALADRLKEKSTTLCDKIQSLDETENELNQIESLRYLDTIEFNKKA